MIELEKVSPAVGPSSPSLKVVGVGGAGCKTLSRIRSLSFAEIEFVGFNTDLRSLELPNLSKKYRLGERVTRGRGAGGNPEIGRKVAEEEKENIKNLLKGAEIILLVAGLGKGTGTGASPVIARIGKEIGALVLAFVFFPFRFEGEKLLHQAEKGLQELQKEVDSLLLFSNDTLLKNKERNIPLKETFREADTLLEEAIRAIGGILFKPGVIDLDFADVKVLLKKGNTMELCVGRGTGGKAGLDAINRALSSPWGRTGSGEIKGALLYILGGENLSLGQIEEVSMTVKEEVSPDLVLGVGIDEMVKDEVKITLLIVKEKYPLLSREEKEERHFQEDLLFPGTENSEDLDLPPSFRRKRNISPN